MIGHEPVLKDEALELLNVKKRGKYIDATLGAGGHGVEILKRGGKLLGIDLDEEAIELAQERVESGGWRIDKDFVLLHENFKNLRKVAEENGFYPADGILFDLGISSMQIAGRKGFSFQKDELLDMRMDPENQGVTARDLLNGLREDQLYELFSKTTQKNMARAVARAVSGAQRVGKVETTGELVKLVEGVWHGRKRRISPATTIFLALRIAVNSEIENLKEALPQALEVLGVGGRLVVISFHSEEDRIVKNFLKDKEKTNDIKILTKKPIVPGASEVQINPRARSAKMRVAEKI